MTATSRKVAPAAILGVDIVDYGSRHEPRKCALTFALLLPTTGDVRDLLPGFMEVTVR
jgi:hypothetical protein